MAKRMQIEDETDEQMAALADYAADAITLTEYMQATGHGEKVSRRFRDEYMNRVIPTLGSPLQPLEFEDDLWEAVKKHGTQLRKFRHTDIEIEVELPDDKPVMVAWMSDLHIGHVNCDHEAIERDAKLVRNTPGLYVILGGDLTDNVNTAVAARGMHHEQLTPVDVQKELVKRLCEFIGPENIIAGILGNHDEWSMKNDGFNPVKWLAKEVGFPYLGAFGYATIKVGDQEYRHLLAHQFRMNSSFNKTHGAKRLMDFVGDAHIVYMGHKHDPAAEQVFVRREKRFFAQAGSYLRSSVYGDRLGFTESSPDMPGSILWPDRHKFDGSFSAFEDVWKLTSAREMHD